MFFRLWISTGSLSRSVTRKSMAVLLSFGLHAAFLVTLPIIAVLSSSNVYDQPVRFTVRLMYVRSRGALATGNSSSTARLSLPPLQNLPVQRGGSGRGIADRAVPGPAVSPSKTLNSDPVRSKIVPVLDSASSPLTPIPENIANSPVVVNPGVNELPWTVSIKGKSFIPPPPTGAGSSAGGLQVDMPGIPQTLDAEVAVTLSRANLSNLSTLTPSPRYTSPPPDLPTVLTRAMRRDHPVNGNFDIIVVQPSLADVLPRGSRLMLNQPVYTVYLDVGDSREWQLHYCAADTQTTQRGSVVTLGDPRPVSAPYPQTTYLPASLPSSSEKFVFVHGIIDGTGTFDELKILGTEAQIPEGFLDVLSHWLFRPAKRGNDAARLEVVLAIPGRRT